MRWGLPPENSIQKNRDLLRQADERISRQGRVSVFGHLLVFLYVEWMTGFQALQPLHTYIIGTALLLAAMIRLYHLVQFESIYPAGPQRWRRRYGVVTLFGAAAWSGFLTLTILLPNYEVPEAFIWIYTAAVCATHIYIFAPYPGMSQWYLRIMLIPPAIASIVLFNISATSLGVGVLLFYWFMRSTGEQVSKQYWDSAENRHRLESELSRVSASEHKLVARVGNSDRFMSNLISIVKTPLNGVLGMLSLLSAAKLRQEEHNLVTVASQSANSLAELVEDFDTYLRVKGNMLAADDKVFNLARTIENVMESLGPLAHEHGLELSYILKPDMPERVIGNVRQVNTLLKQLTNFAINTGVAGEVSLKGGAAQDREGVDISVRFVADLEASLLEDIQSMLRNRQGFEALDYIDVNILSLVICASLVQQCDGEIRLNVLSTEEPHLLQVSVFLPIATSTQGNKAFLPNRHFHGKTACIAGFPPYGTASVAAELEGWGMQVDIRTMDELLSMGDAVYEIDFCLVNIPLHTSEDEQKQIQELVALTDANDDDDKPRIYFQASASQQGLLRQWMRADLMISKPVSRRTLHRWMLDRKTWRDDLNEQVTQQLLGYRILVVDSNHVNAMIAQKILQRLGVEVELANSAEHALALFRQDSFDMIWVDQYLNDDMTGHELVGMIRNEEKEQGAGRVIILGLTDSQTVSIERNCQAAGMDDVLAKPLSLPLVTETLQRHFL
ncbi:response regulator [Salinispirillum sp. LH 10-3-1]|uniref:histidine kinase n=1 Tax=Salinispirillum sp. LH 10-3-1 TaxID=2952525 RepID=A0AB38YC92_9GAMM